jgi:hypothetical protein
MKKIICSISIICGLNSFGQTDASKHAGIKETYFSFGMQAPDLNGLNDLLGQNSFPTFSSNMFSFGISTVEFKRWLPIQLEFFILGQTRSQASNTFTLASSSFRNSLVGYKFVDKSNFKIFSTLGASIQGTSCTIRHKPDDNTSVSAYLSGKANVHSLGILHVNLDLATNINYYVGFRKSDTIKPLFLGLRAAYGLPVFSSKWRIEGEQTKISKEPRINPLGLALHFTVGYIF